MGGIGTNQQKHRENQKKQKKQKQTIFQRSWGWGGLAQSKKNIEKTKEKKKQKKKQYSRGLGDGGGSHQEFPNIVFCCFFGFLNVFLISLHGVLPKETQCIFLIMLSLHGGLY